MPCAPSPLFSFPFISFPKGSRCRVGALVLNARLYGAVFSVVVIPVRVGKNCLQARYFSHRSVQGRLRVAIALTPTLIFTLVIAGILHEEDTVHPDPLHVPLRPEKGTTSKRSRRSGLCLFGLAILYRWSIACARQTGPGTVGSRATHSSAQ